MRKLWERIQREAHTRHFHIGHHCAHLIYFGAVTVEGHGVYSAAAAALLIFTILGAIGGEA